MRIAAASPVYLFLICRTMCADPVKVTLLSSLPSPQKVGTSIGLSPHIEHAPRGAYVYRYSISVDGGPFHIVRDFSQAPGFVWTPALFEHEARARVTVRVNRTNDSWDAEIPFRITSRVADSRPSVSATAHPLVALFSAPPCPAASGFRVVFRAAGTSGKSQTPLQPCRDSISNNVYVAGMHADSAYEMRSEIVNGSEAQAGEWLPFHTGLLDGEFPPVSVPVPAAAADPSAEPILIHGLIGMSDHARPIATDLDGRMVWYLRQPAGLMRIVPGGRILTLNDGENSASDIHRDQLVQEFDLAGNLLRETNASRVAEQLESRGIKSDCKKGGAQCFSGFHHDAIRLPNGHTLVMGGLERMFPAGTQGSKGPVDVLGDAVVDLDEDLQVAWVWDAFDSIDVQRKSVGDAKCQIGPGADGCPSVFLADSANGWLHSNSITYAPKDGSLIISMPEQNWVVKIDYKNGAGTGKLLWRLGEGGDFTVKSADPEPWFSYQHDAGFEPADSDLLSVLDDGHERQKTHPGAHTRGQVWKLDEQAKTAELVYNADLGGYSVAVGSAQKLSGGGYSFELGFIDPGPTPHSFAVETSADGKIVYTQRVDGGIDYRSFRVADLYSAPTKR